MNHALNAVCPYYTMYPLGLPLGILSRHASRRAAVLDPFCGRGTTNFAARILGLTSTGIDSSPIAVAIAQAKLANADAAEVLASAKRALRDADDSDVPEGEFWERCYAKDTLRQVCALRQALLRHCQSDAQKLLRAILLGALHGPLTKAQPSHLSNQSPRTFAPKPAYAVRFWKRNRMTPPRVQVLDVVRQRAERYLSSAPGPVSGTVVLGDSRMLNSYPNQRYSLIVTSPPYYGMRTYIPDQWIRNWFLGGPSEVAYKPPASEMSHQSPVAFGEQLRQVWLNVAQRSTSCALLVIRFGGINDRKRDPLQIVKGSLAGTPWRITTVRAAGTADEGRRQAEQFGTHQRRPMTEFDIYARLN